MLKVTLETLDEAVVLHCAGRIVRGDETSLLCAASRNHGRAVILDLEKVESIDAAGVGALVALQAAGIYVQVLNPSAAVRELLQVTHVDSVVEISGASPAPAAARAVA